MMLFRHLKTGGLYRLNLICLREEDLVPLVVYSAAKTGVLWTRPAKEFFDGRFEAIVHAPESTPEAMSAEWKH